MLVFTVVDSLKKSERTAPKKNTTSGKNAVRRKKASKVTVADKAIMQRLYDETGNLAEVARRTGWDYQTVWTHLRGPQNKSMAPRAVPGVTTHIAQVDIPPPKSWDDLTPQEKGWLTNFAEFRRHFFRRDTPPFHQEIANKISSKEDTYLLVLCPPGHGKSQSFSVDYPIWEMIRARAMGTKDGWACLLISKSDKMARAFLSQIKRELEQNIDLQVAFGRFKPESPELWKQDMITVEGFPIRKEPTFITAGAGSQIYGWRVHLIIADDIVDSENSANPQQVEKLATWYADELMSRLDPGGVIANVGTRFATFDLHGRLWRQKDDSGDPLWTPIIYKAHDESRCTGDHCMEKTCKDKCIHDKPWPEGCVLWPAWFSYQQLRRRRSGQVTSARFEFVYNQVEVPDEGALVKQEWIDACKNKNRLMWDIPRGARVCCTLDPSPTEWAVAECWAYLPGEDKRYLVAVWRKRRVMAPEYIALMRDWTVKIRQLGFDPMWIVEINAAQRWLLQSTEYMQLRNELGLTVTAHTTGRNKADPQYGIQCLGPAYEYGKVDIPWGDRPTMLNVTPLIDELVVYPAGETDDAVMANWFHEHNIRKMSLPITGQFVNTPGMPPYLLATRSMTDLRTQRTRMVDSGIIGN